MRKPKIYLIVSILLAFLLSGCINITQSIEINADGSGKFSMDLGMSEMLLNMGEEFDEESEGGKFSLNEMKEDMELTSDNPYVTNVKVDEYNEEGYKHFSVEADISDMHAFLSDLQAEDNSGIKFTLQQKENGNMHFVQVIDLSEGVAGEDISEEEMSEFSNLMVANAFQGNYWTLTLKLPNVVETNGEWDEETNTVTWSIPMADVLMDQEMYEMSAEYRPPSSGITPQYYLLGGVVALAILAVLGYLIFRGRKNSEQGTDTEILS